jgi:hypothetical protein
MEIKVSRETTIVEMPKEVSDFFWKLKQEHAKKMDTNMLLEEIHISVNMHNTEAKIETVASSFDKSKHYLSQM